MTYNAVRKVSRSRAIAMSPLGKESIWLRILAETFCSWLDVCFISSAYKHFLFWDPPLPPSLQGETMGIESLMKGHKRVDLGARTWYSHALWHPQGSGSTKTPSSRSSAITGGPSSRAIHATRIATCRPSSTRGSAAALRTTEEH